MKDNLNLIIDARMVNEHLHGIGRYTYEIVRGISLCRYNINIMLLVNDINLSKNIFGQYKNVEFIKMNAKFLSLQEQIELPVILNKFDKKRTIFHSPSFVSSPFIKCKTIMTIHDLNHLRFPQFYTKFHKYYYKYIVKTSALRTKKIITVSQFSKHEIVQWLGCDEDKVLVTYNGIDKSFHVINNKDSLLTVREKYNIPEKFILYIGNLKSHKNVQTVVKSMELVKSDIKLVINGEKNDSIDEIIIKNKLEDRIKFIGYVDEVDLPYLYNLADIFVFPSLYEGFGLPPLEAMACGCPVICSNTSSLPEVVGDAAIKVDPYDVRKFADSIDLIINDREVHSNLVNRGIEQSNKFLWKDAVNITLEEYDSV